MKPLLVFYVLAAGSLWGQCHKLGEVNAASPEGQLLQQAGQEADSAKKLALLEQFAGQYPQHEAIGWVDEQLLDGYVKAKDGDKALAIGEKLNALPPECVESAQQTLKAAAEIKKDPDQVLKWAARTEELAQKVVASPQPQDADEVENWKARVEYSKQVKTYADYTLYATALATTDARKQVALVEALRQSNPQSQYVPQTTGVLFLAYQKAGAKDKALALAQQEATAGRASEDMLLVLADDAANHKDGEKVHTYSAKLVETMSARPKPEGVADDDWNKRKSTITGLAYYMSGKQYVNDGKFGPGDQELRKALPLVETNAALKPEVLFFLGLANYKMEKIQDASNFFKACAALKSPYQAQANKNLVAMRAQYHGVK